MKREDVDVIQLALPVSGDNENQVLNNLRQEVASLQEAWTGQRPSAIPMVPEELTMDVFLNLPTTQEAIQNHELPIAISCEEAEIIPINPSTLKNIIVLSESKQSLQYTICHLISVINHCLSNGHVLLVDSNEEYSFLREKANAYISGEEILELFSNLDKEITNRKETPKDVQTFIVIPDLASFVEKVSISEDDFYQLYINAYKYGLHFITAGSKSVFFKVNPVIKCIKENITTAVIAMRLYDQSIVEHNSNNREKKLEWDQAYIYDKGRAQKVKLIKQEIEE